MPATRLARPIAAAAVLAGAMVVAPPDPTQAQTLAEGYRLVDTWTTRQPATVVPRFERPQGVDVDVDDRVYVVDGDASRLVRLDDAGAVDDSWPIGDEVPRPFDVAVARERVLVVGRNAGEILDLDGRVLRTISLPGVSGAAAGPEDRFFVARRTSSVPAETEILVLSADGDVIEAWSADPIVIVTPRGLDVAADGRVFLAADGAVYIFEDGAVTGGLRVPRTYESGTVIDVAVDASNRVFAAQGSGPQRLVGWDGDSGDVIGVGGMPGAQSVAVGPGAGLVSGVYVQGGFAGVGRLPDRSDLDGPVDRWGDADHTLGELVGPRRIATTGTDDLFIVDRRPRVQLWSAAGLPMRQLPADALGYLTDLAGGWTQPCAVAGRSVTCLAAGGAPSWSDAPSTDGWLVAADASADRVLALDLAEQSVWLYDRSGRRIGGWPVSEPDTFAAVADVALDDGTIYVARRAARQIVVRGLDGQPKGPGSIDVAGEVLRVDARDGYVYALTSEGWIWKYDGAGGARAVWSPSPDDPPSDLAVGRDGRVYVSVPGRVEAAPEEQGRVMVFEPGGTPPTAPPEAPDEACMLSVDKAASPDAVTIGDTVQVVLTVEGSCPAGDGRLDVALLIDQSGSMAGNPMAAAQAAAISFLGQLDPSEAQVSVIGFSTTATVLQSLSGNLRDVVRAVGRIEAGGQTNYRDALEKALVELTSGSARPDAPKVAVLMTDGKPTDRNLAMRAADDLKSVGATLYTIGLGANVDSDLLRHMATEPELYFEAPSETELADVYTVIARRITATRLLHRGIVMDELPADMELVTGSATPAARVDGRTLTWTLSEVRTTGTVIRYQVRPRMAGLRPTNALAVLTYEDVTGNRGDAVFPVPRVQVRPRTSWITHLPIVWKNRCKPQRADVVLVFDVSSSMAGPASPGAAGTKLEAALRAGRTFLDAMMLPGDQASVVTFDGQARRLQGLTGARGALELALTQVTPGSGTRIDRGIELAIVELLSARHDMDHNPVMIVLTDGLPQAGTETRALRVARDAHAAGIHVYTVGLGADADPDLLWLIAGADERSFLAPDAHQLEAIYARIAGQVLCD